MPEFSLKDTTPVPYNNEKLSALDFFLIVAVSSVGGLPTGSLDPPAFTQSSPNI